MEACDGGRTALVVPRGDAEALAAAIERLADEPALRKSMAERALAYVRDAYEYRKCFRYIQDIYESHESVRGWRG